MTRANAQKAMEHHWRKPVCSTNGKPVPMGLSLEHAATPPHVLAHQWSRVTRAHPSTTRSCTAALCLRRRSPRTAGQHAEQVTKWGRDTCRELARGDAEVCSAARAAAIRRRGRVRARAIGHRPGAIVWRVNVIATDTRWRAWTRIDAERRELQAYLQSTSKSCPTSGQ